MSENVKGEEGEGKGPCVCVRFWRGVSRSHTKGSLKLHGTEPVWLLGRRYGWA